MKKHIVQLKNWILILVVILEQLNFLLTTGSVGRMRSTIHTFTISMVLIPQMLTHFLPEKSDSVVRIQVGKISGCVLICRG